MIQVKMTRQFLLPWERFATWDTPRCQEKLDVLMLQEIFGSILFNGLVKETHRIH